MNASQPADDEYRSGAYFADPSRHAADAEFKAERFLRLIATQPLLGTIRTMADVGCGSGAATIAVAAGLRTAGFQLTDAVGYDVSPHVTSLRHPDVRFVHADFGAGGGPFDLVTLFDVIEHVPDPIGFLRRISARATFIGLHIPLDNSLNCSLRDLFRRHLKDPGHLVALDTAAALNLLAFAGLRVLDYEYVLGFEAAGADSSLLSRCAYPLRAGIAALSPWLLAKTLGGISLMVLCRVPNRPPSIAPGSGQTDHDGSE